MRQVLKYCHCRKDGTCNGVAFDTETKTYTNRIDGNHDFYKLYKGRYVFVEAAMSRDVDKLRSYLDDEGYICTDNK